MKKAEKKDFDKLMDFLKKDIPNCLYIYADLVSLGIGYPNLTFWIQEKDEKIISVIMQYYNSFQLYGDLGEEEYKWIAEAVDSDSIDRISGEITDIENLKEYLPPDFSDHYGVIFSFDRSTDVEYKNIVTEAGAEDVDGIAELIMTDKNLSGSYTEEELKNQLSDRIINNKGRSFIIKSDGKIIGHICFLIETDLFAIAGWAIVHPEHRDVKSALRLQHAVYELTKNDNKDHYFFIDQPRRAKMFEATGNKVVAKYGKLVKETGGK